LNQGVYWFGALGGGGGGQKSGRPTGVRHGKKKRWHLLRPGGKKKKE